MKKYIYLLLFLIVFVGCEAIFIEDISEANVVLWAPSNNVELDRGTIDFNWEDLIDATEYQIQIATPNFKQANQIVLDSIISASFFSVDIDSGAYQWRVKAMNSGYATDYTTNSFTVN